MSTAWNQYYAPDTVAAALRASGADQANADAVADVVTRAERDGCASHGVFRVPGYCSALKAGAAKGDAQPKVERRAPGVVFVDGDHGLAPLATALGTPVLAAAAKETGIASMAIRDSAHFAALWPDVEPLAEQGLLAMSFVNSRAFVAPALWRWMIGINALALGTGILTLFLDALLADYDAIEDAFEWILALQVHVWFGLLALALRRTGFGATLGRSG